MKILILIPLLFIAGCATKETQLRMSTAQTNALTCQQAVLKYKQTLASQKVVFTDERNALMYLMMKELSNSKASGELEACDDMAIAQIRGQAAKTSGLINGGVRLGGLGLGLWGVSILTNGVTDLAGSSSTAKTQNNYNSRVVSDSNATGGSSISSSGTGMGIGNTGGGADTVGGLYPRSQMDTVATDGGTNSNSGELTVIPLPEEAPVTIE